VTAKPYVAPYGCDVQDDAWNVRIKGQAAGPRWANGD
jgi:hypothetical protein